MKIGELWKWLTQCAIEKIESRHELGGDGMLNLVETACRPGSYEGASRKYDDQKRKLNMNPQERE